MEGPGAGCAPERNGVIRRAQPIRVRPLEPGRIELWCAFLPDLDAERLEEVYAALLTEAERARQRRLRFAEDRRRDLAARVLVRTVLSRYASVPPETWVFGVDARGRPRIVAPQPATPLQFNIAHSGDLVVVGVAPGNPLGVDVEQLARRTDTTRLERYFAPLEIRQMRALPARARRLRFFELWTLKESYLKARGVGLRMPLHSLAFEFPGPGAVRLSLAAAVPDRASRWAFAQFTLRDEYMLAVCAERAGLPPLQLAVHEVVPLGSQRRLAPRLARASGIEAASPAGEAESGR